ncbi:MAG: hypothetical protein R1F54_09505 [Candidatus Zeuxoniibacter abyssi]|nr:MAG: hypothetical protein R1F54_09505 [Candidatus Persebacteraceae bacterium AB1(2)]
MPTSAPALKAEAAPSFVAVFASVAAGETANFPSHCGRIFFMRS